MATTPHKTRQTQTPHNIVWLHHTLTPTHLRIRRRCKRPAWIIRLGDTLWWRKLGWRIWSNAWNQDHVISSGSLCLHVIDGIYKGIHRLFWDSASGHNGPNTSYGQRIVNLAMQIFKQQIGSQTIRLHITRSGFIDCSGRDHKRTPITQDETCQKPSRQ